MSMEPYPRNKVVGVDVSKDKLDFAFADDNHARSTKNTEEQIVY